MHCTKSTHQQSVAVLHINSELGKIEIGNEFPFMIAQNIKIKYLVINLGTEGRDSPQLILVGFLKGTQEIFPRIDKGDYMEIKAFTQKNKTNQEQ